MLRALSPEVVVLISQVVLGAVCLLSAARTLQVHRGASAGFLLHGLGSVVVCLLFPGQAEALSASTWIASVIGQPLLVFSFFWLSGDRSTANLVLSSALLLASISGYLTHEARCVAPYFTKAGATLSILVISLFTGNWYGLLGSLALGTEGLLSFLNASRILPFSTEIASNCVLSAAFLALETALRTHLCDTT
ncbi:transmembrane protein 276 [Pseudophryne corroboree]|uniref:transmembrane protein 276 n=1 Tax=Pseudophryne corroboree TaxID=495146 RepID=UPI003081F929